MTGRRDCDTPASAAEAACALGNGVAVAMTSDGRSLAILTVTPFGAAIKRWSDLEPAQAAEILADTVRAQSASFVSVTEEVPADGGAFDRFLGYRPSIPVYLDEQGKTRASWWTVAPYHPIPFEPGDRLSPVVLHGARGCSVAYFHRDGRHAGMHIVTERVFDAREVEIVRMSTAVVRTVASGRGHDDKGVPIDTQILALDVPHEFAVAFSEGVLPLRPMTDLREVANA